MAMAVDSRQQGQLAGLPYNADNTLRYPQAPNFSNPWAQAGSAAPASSQYAASLASPNGAMDATSQASRAAPLGLAYAAAAAHPPQPMSQAPLGSGSVVPPAGGLLEQLNLLGASPGMMSTPRTYADYSSAPAAYAPSSTAAAYPMGSTAGYGYQDTSRRGSHPLSDVHARSGFNEAMEASRNIMQMRDSDITPRANVYGNAGDRSSVSSYGFPSTHSTHSSISSASYNQSPYSAYGSVAGDSSVTDYSSASESVDLNSRTLPRPSSLIGTNVPAPQSMMGQFSSKVASSSQKKHKCKICDKRFTRPSSLQTHMYSHTGEKPFACEVEGCGRHFSVVSNLRRHRKVHKGDGDHDDHPSPED